jgi:hypothetical protein
MPEPIMKLGMHIMALDSVPRKFLCMCIRHRCQATARKNVAAAMNKHATIEELDASLYTRYVSYQRNVGS